MRSVEEHREQVARLLADHLPDLCVAPETLVVQASHWNADPARYAARTLAADVVAPVSLPPFANSQMDGFAVNAGDLVDAPVDLMTVASIPAGIEPPPLRRGTTAAVMTGAPIPDGADAVVPVERVVPARFVAEGDLVGFPDHVVAGTFVRSAGSDVRIGDVLLPRGQALWAAQWGVLAAAGVGSVEVTRRLRALVISTGSELTAAGRSLEPAHIFDANALALSMALGEIGVETTVDQVLSDHAEDLLAVLDRHTDADLVITTGGVSAGAYEVVRDALGPLGVDFISVGMQPGGPQGLGAVPVGTRTVPVVAFPGNPVSTLISFEMFLRPALLGVVGPAGRPRTVHTALLAESCTSPPEKHQVRRGRMRPDGRVDLVGGPASHLITSYARSDVLVHLPVGMAGGQENDTVTIWRIDG